MAIKEDKSFTRTPVSYTHLHTFGREKYKTIGLSEPALFPIPDDQKIIEYERMIQAMQKKKHHP